MKAIWIADFYTLPGWMNKQEDRETFRNFTMRGLDTKEYGVEDGLTSLSDGEVLTLTTPTHFKLVSIGVSK